MRILVVTGKIMDESLSATTRTGIMAALSERADVTLIARFRHEAAANLVTGISVTPVAAPPVPGLSMLWFQISAALKSAKALRRAAPDVVFIEPSAVSAVILARMLVPRSSAPVHLDLRTLPIAARGLRALLDRAFTAANLRAARGLCSGYSAISLGAAEWLAQRVGVPSDRVTVWGTGVDPSRFDPAAHVFPSPAERPVRLLYHGAIYLSRGLETLIEAIALLPPEVARDVRLTILGSGPDTSALAHTVTRLHLEDHVRLVDAVPPDEVAAEIAAHHAGVLPLPDLECWRTSSPTKLLEYVSMARPVIVTDIDAHRSVLGTAGSAVWAGKGSASELAEAITDLVERLPRLTESARDARDGITLDNSWRHQADILSGALSSLAGSEAAPVRRYRRMLAAVVTLALVLASIPLTYRVAFETLLPRQPDVRWTPPARPPQATQQGERLQDALDEYSDAQGGIALQATVIASDGAVWNGTAGYSDIGNKVPVTAEDHFVLGSITKTMFATIAMRQVEAGRLSLDDTIDKWTPEIPESDRITVRMLMDHTSGIRSYSRNRWYRMASHSIPWLRWRPAELIALIEDDVPAGAPGGDHIYSNTNYVVLGTILERSTGRSAADLLRDEIASPLSLGDTSFITPPSGTRMPRGYDENEIGRGRRDVSLLVPETASAGYTSAGAISTSSDVASFLDSLFRGRLVSDESLKLMTDAVPTSNPSNPYQIGYGLGLVEWQLDGWRWWGHVGVSPGYSSLAMYSPENETTVVVLTNLSSIDRVELVSSLQEALEGP